MKGIKVVFVNFVYILFLCLVCGRKLSLNGYRVLKCFKCGFEVDRDVIGFWNIFFCVLKMWGVFVFFESFMMKMGVGKVGCSDVYEFYINYG